MPGELAIVWTSVVICFLCVKWRLAESLHLRSRGVNRQAVSELEPQPDQEVKTLVPVPCESELVTNTASGWEEVSIQYRS